VHFDIPGTSISAGANPVRDALVAGTMAGVNFSATPAFGAPSTAGQDSVAPITTMPGGEFVQPAPTMQFPSITSNVPSAK
jgi:hypothetical protein